MDWEEARRLTPPMDENDLRERILAHLPHYLWMTGDLQRRECWCSACGRRGERDFSHSTPNRTPSVDGSGRHLHRGSCPWCGADVEYRLLNKSHRSLYDRLFLTIYQKSAEQNTLVARTWEVNVPWGELDEYEPLYVPEEHTEIERCVFRYGKGAWRFGHEFEWVNCVTQRGADGTPIRGYWDKHYECRWKWRRECVSRYMAQYMGNGLEATLDEEAFAEAVEGTPWAYIMKETRKIGWSDKITMMARAAKYPCIEYLYKLGLRTLADEAITWGDGCKLLNLRGKTPTSVLRVGADDWSEIRGKHITMDVRRLKTLQAARKLGLRVSVEAIAKCASNREYEPDKTLQRMVQARGAGMAAKALRYCAKKDVPIGDWLDQSEMMNALDMQTSDEWLFPRDFARKHGELSGRIAGLGNALKDEQIAKRLPKLREYCFSALGLVLRPMLTSREIIEEGTIKHICVGSYVGRYADGNTILCVIRRETAMDVPLYTVEFTTKGALVQCRGYYNREPDEADNLPTFWALFEMMRAQLHKQEQQADKRLKDEERRAKVA